MQIFCNREYKANFTFKNNSKSIPSNSITNAYVYIYNTIALKDIIVIANGDTLKNVGNKFYIPAQNLDGDDIESDIPADSTTSYFFEVSAKADTSVNAEDARMYIRVYYTNTEGTAGYSNSFSSGAPVIGDMNLLSPPDAAHGDSATYEVSNNYGSYNLYNTLPESKFLDVDTVAIVYNNEDVVYPTWNYSIQSPVNANVLIDCDAGQRFNMEMSTDNCSARELIGFEDGIAVLDCGNDSLIECAVIKTVDLEQINPIDINTCTELPIKATGQLSHYCDTCPEITHIIARVYDLDEKLTFSSISQELTVNGGTPISMIESDDAISNGIAWKVPVDLVCNGSDLNIEDLLLDGSVIINGNHSLPDSADYNLRVEFAFVTEGSVTHNGNSRGMNVRLYDPEPIVNSSFGYGTRCNDEEVYFQIWSTYAESDVANHPFRITNVLLPEIPDFTYSTFDHMGEGVKFTESDLSEENEISGYYTINGTNKKGMFSQSLKADNCLVGGQSLTTGTAIIEYTDFYESCSDTTRKTYERQSRSRAYAPRVTVEPTSQQNITRDTRWDMVFTNEGNWATENTIIRIQPDSNNKVGFEYKRLILNGENLTPGQDFVLDVSTNTIYLNLGAITTSGTNSESRLSLVAQALDCESEGSNYINVDGFWSCSDSIMSSSNIAEEFEAFGCTPISTQLELINLLAILEAESHYSDSTYKLCDNIPVSLDIYNVGRANLSEVGFWIETVGGNTASIVDKKINFEYAGLSYNKNYDDEELTENNSYLSRKVIDIENDTLTPLPPRQSDNDVVKLNFDFTIVCAEGDEITHIYPIEYVTKAVTNCGDVQQKSFIYNPPIAGLEQLKDIGIEAKATPFETVGITSISTLTVDMTNNSDTPLEHSIVTIDLPNGVVITTQSGSTEINGYIISTNGNTVTLTAPDSYAIQPGQTATFTLQLQDNLDCSPLNTVASVAGGILKELEGCGGEPCPVQAETVEKDVELERIQMPITVTISGDTTVCENSNSVLTASGADTYAWSNGSTNATTAVQYPTTTYSVIGTTNEGCKGQDTITVSFIPSPETPTVSIVVNNQTVTDGIVQYSVWSSQGTAILVGEPTGGTWSQISAPTENCGTYIYRYTILNECDSAYADVTFDVVNCCEEECTPNDLVVSSDSEKTGYTTLDGNILKYYIENPSALVSIECGYTITLDVYCSEPKTFTLNSCFLENADFNNDGFINIADLDILNGYILENKGTE
ncbi:MAG: hypothetical protein PF481_01360 [Bacteroidales bacterium]|nr:hypothetical protein [Bacteroidales bacterium]